MRNFFKPTVLKILLGALLWVLTYLAIYFSLSFFQPIAITSAFYLALLFLSASQYGFIPQELAPILWPALEIFFSLIIFYPLGCLLAVLVQYLGKNKRWEKLIQMTVNGFRDLFGNK